MAGKTATVLARMEPELKEQAEEIMDQLGIPVSVVINCLYKQIVFTRSIPFPLGLPNVPKSRQEMTAEEFKAKIAMSLDEAKNGRGLKVAEAVSKIKQEL